MSSKKSEAMAAWTGATKFEGLCDECVNKTNKDIAYLKDRDLCKNHYVKFFIYNQGLENKKRAGK